MTDHLEIKAIRRLGAAVLSTFAQDQVKIFSAAMRGRQGVWLDGTTHIIGSIDDEISAARRYMGSKDFRDVCDLAGVEVRVEPAIEHMLRVARVFDGGRKGVTAELAMNAWGAE
jgi:hypothetical protein